ncbi:hypothetical protein RhiirC2_842986 [Rhizophagus irregularis]|uniref:F-box domain-containing protein n=1 Tax=Rhizophagus irregularis TaxID=588596 RepID=A0A2N1NYP4_9GLOM|nr:hypothetical protein RhiirC2_842986 [Rhizophagus irregularis]
MSNLNKDILYLIFEQLHDDKKSLFSCLLVNNTWCETIIPILWRNPWKSNLKKENETLLLNVIISHLSNVSRNKIGRHKLLTNSYQEPLFDYISYCRHLNLDEILRIINNNIQTKILKVQEEILNRFINENTKFTHLYINRRFNYPIQLVHGAEHCLSRIEFLSCCTSINDNILSKLIEACKSIKELELSIDSNNYGIIRLIEAQRKLLNIYLVRSSYNNESHYKNIENSLIKHANTIQYYKITERPSIKLLSSFINLNILELDGSNNILDWNCLENISFPFLQILKSSGVPVQALTNLIKNTNGFLIEIKIDYISHNQTNNKKIIQAIYQNCPNLKYLKLVFRNCNISELKMLLITCQYLNGLYILIDSYQDNTFDWDGLFEILTKSSSNGLFKFKIYSYAVPILKSLELFFNSWKGRRPMLLQIISVKDIDLEMIKRYKKEGIIKKYDFYLVYTKRTIEDFEWN